MQHRLLDKMSTLLPKSWIKFGKVASENPHNDIESGDPADEIAYSTAEAPALFFAEANNVLRDVESVGQSVRNIEAAYVRSNDVQEGPVLAFRKEMSEDLSLIATLAQAMKENLADIQRDRLTILKGPGGWNEAVNPQRHNVHSQLLQKLQKIEHDIEAIRTTIISGHSKVVERRLFSLTGQHHEPEEVKSFIQNHQSEKMIRQALMHQRGSGGRDVVVDTIAELYDRRKEVEDLSGSLEQLRAVFQDLSTTVDNHMHVLDKIEDQVRSGHYDVQESAPWLHSLALELSQAQMLLLVTFITVVILGAVALIVFLGGPS